MKPEATAIGDPQNGRWKITLMFDGRTFWIPKFRYSVLQQMTRQCRHWWFPTTSCFGVTNHSEAASLWLVRQDRASINSGSLPSCSASFWQWSVASPSEIGWLASKVSRYLSILCLWLFIWKMLCPQEHMAWNSCYIPYTELLPLRRMRTLKDREWECWILCFSTPKHS